MHPKIQSRLTLKACPFRNMESRMAVSDRILGPTPMWLHDLMECRYSISPPIAHHSVPYCLDISCNIISLICWSTIWRPVSRHFPILGITAGHNHADKKLVGIWSGDLSIADCHHKVFIDECFFHDGVVQYDFRYELALFPVAIQ